MSSTRKPKAIRPSAERQIAEELVREHQLSIQRACRVVRLPNKNAYIERINRSDRIEVLNAHLFESIAERRALTDAWLRIYNSERPHAASGGSRR